MKNQAERVLEQIENNFNGMYMGGLIVIDNNITIDYLNDECVAVKELCEQETWVMDDGSYITRNDDLYYSGNDIVDFEITHDENKCSCC